ncbi:hypothetical protein TVAG_204960 [Trichomonas vaginalis G3]|uniref:Uncharacterized protein n=1 Tax=Trichomonas vaginalis (strain ATCC PRA-98 / G3) TaxID=412133 RepID=A2EIZ8_TRIV3|nr:hypothetical protein TVAGG3_0661730 [Trichomonas vaginalis G3]EAY07388.1 hypothetical protein TVAG_204960 [Trichomonas vaginalis G3]KAI5506541.1 hypothetical protein TVAGG3_0661730 [Trichomonas vaginalis G3]|eukprot:XP_001319611.1 hypothetical protein [Trichomonas vaginalis G3]
MESHDFSHIDNVLADVDRYLMENSTISDPQLKENPPTTKNPAQNLSPVSKAHSDINSMLKRFNVDQTEVPRQPRINFNFDTNQSSSIESSSFNYELEAGPKGSPSYKFMNTNNNSFNQNTSFTNSSNLSQKYTTTQPNTTGYDNYLYKSQNRKQTISRGRGKIQTAEEIEIEMLQAENASLLQELQQYQTQLIKVQNRNSELLQMIENNECELYEIKNRK